MSPGPDLSRWNRAGLSKFRYVDGNAITFLEDLRVALGSRFPDWQAVQVEVPADEPPSQALERIVAQYEAAPGDLAWELLRTLARAGYVLTEHLDAYANESYLGTATQWDNVRMLVEMLDYHPAPPASAATQLALTAKEEARGTVEAGLQVQHVPDDGSAPVIFETLDDLEVDAALNELRLAGWNRSPKRLTGSRLTLDGEYEDLATGQPILLEDERNGRLDGRLITGFKVADGRTRVDLSAPPLDGTGLRAGWTRVHLQPAESLEPLGPASKGAEIERGLYLQEPPEGLRPGEVVFVGDGVNSYYRRVTAVQGRRIVLDADLGQLHLDGAFVSRARTLSISSQVQESRPVSAVRVVGDFSSLQGAVVADLKTSGATKRLVELEVFAAAYQPIDPDAPDSGFTTLRIDDPQNELVNPQAIYLPPVTEEWAVDSYLEPAPRNPLPLALVTEKPKKSSAGDLVAVVSGRMMAWARLDSVDVDDEASTGTLNVGRWRHRSGAPYFLHGTEVHGHFKEEARVVGWDVNTTPVRGAALPLSSLPDSLVVGRQLLIARRDGDEESEWLAAEVIELRRRSTVLISPGLPARAGFTLGNTVLYGNVVEAGHGESRPAKVLASGDATASNPRYVLEQEGISFVADPTQPSGVRAAVDVTVGERTWQPVATLRTSGPTDPHYTVRMTEEGYLAVEFGDGTHGRRLPTGSNNVRAAFRVGNGLEGNLAAGSLAKMVRPHRQLAAVRQPLAATGGNAMESVESMRDNAPASVLSLERAVSLGDFANLAARQSSVWQAAAFSQPTTAGRHDSVEVVVVPAGGGELGSLVESLEQFLEQHALPGVEVSVGAYVPGPFDLDVTVRVKTAEYDPEAVKDAVTEALLATFSLERRSLGQDLFLSEVFAVVEAVEGVENSSCVLDGDPEVRRRHASQREVVFLHPEVSRLDVIHEEFEL